MSDSRPRSPFCVRARVSRSNRAHQASIRRRAALFLALVIWPISASASGPNVDFAPITGALSVVSIFVVAGYFVVQFFGRKARLLLLELVFIVEDGNEIARSIEKLRDEAHHGALGRRTTFTKWIAVLRKSRILDAELHVRSEAYGIPALCADAVDLERQQSAVVATRDPAGHRHYIVGLIYTLDVVGDLRSGGFDEAMAHLDFLHDHLPIDTDCLHAYCGPLAEGDDGEEFLQELGRTRLRIHSPELDLI